jgi:hypothetical protein
MNVSATNIPACERVLAQCPLAYYVFCPALRAMELVCTRHVVRYTMSACEPIPTLFIGLHNLFLSLGGRGLHMLLETIEFRRWTLEL